MTVRRDFNNTNRFVRIAKFDPEKTRRGDTTIKKSDIPGIARLYFEDTLSLEQIAQIYRVDRRVIKDIVVGENFLHEWSKAVVDLLVEGVDVSRKPERNKAPGIRKLTKDNVIEIRKLHMDTHVTSHQLAERYGVSVHVISNVILNKNYITPEYFPEGWEL
jgi:plasmid maintenance system antidote protein VapI